MGAAVTAVNTTLTHYLLMWNSLANIFLFTHPASAFHQLLREISGSFAAKCSTMFTSLLLNDIFVVNELHTASFYELPAVADYDADESTESK